MSLTNKMCAATLLAVLLGGAATSRAEVPIDVEVATAKGVPITAPQEWAQLLGELQLASVRLRGGQGDEMPLVTKVEDAPHLRFKVVAVLDRNGNLLVPRQRFRLGDRKALADYFQALAQNESFGEELGSFGLTKEQFQQVFNDLSPAVGISTMRKTPAEVLAHLEARFKLPVVHDSGVNESLRLAKPLDHELREMSAGTALALALRDAHLALRPEKPTGEPLQLVVEPDRTDGDAWPVGWKPEGSPRLAAPKMFEFLNVEVKGYTLAKALEALEPRLGVSIIYDQRVLTERDIHPDQIEVKLPPGKTYLKRVVDRLLSQARLAGELRVDEAGRPFYWVTQYGPDSPRAE